MSVNIKSVKSKVRQKKLINFSTDFFGISDVRSVDNCLEMTAYDGIGGNHSKATFLDTKNYQQSPHYCLSSLDNSFFTKIGVFDNSLVRKMKNFPETVERE